MPSFLGPYADFFSWIFENQPIASTRTQTQPSRFNIAENNFAIRRNRSPTLLQQGYPGSCLVKHLAIFIHLFAE